MPRGGQMPTSNSIPATSAETTRARARTITFESRLEGSTQQAAARSRIEARVELHQLQCFPCSGHILPVLLQEVQPRPLQVWHS